MDINNNFNKLDTSIQKRIEQEEKYIQDIQSGLVKIIKDLHSCHDSVLDELRNGTLSNEKRDELADLIAATDDRIARFANAEPIPVADTRARTRKNPFRSFWGTPPVAVGRPVLRQLDQHLSTQDENTNPVEIDENYFKNVNSPYSQYTPPDSGAHVTEVYDLDEKKTKYHVGGTRRRRRRR